MHLGHVFYQVQLKSGTDVLNGNVCNGYHYMMQNVQHYQRQ